MSNITEQIRRNMVAIISLVVAITSLGYNTWRNEVTEANRNVRHAGFEMVRELSSLQEVVLFARYDQEDARGDLKAGWAHVLAAKDLSYAMPDYVQRQVLILFKTWEQQSSALLEDQNDGYEQIDQAIDDTKEQILIAVRALK